jgi:hypothetical protein
VSAASQPPDQHLITPAQLGIRWGLSLHTLSQWRANNSGPAYLRLGDGERPRIRYRLVDVQEYERRQLENRQ